VISFLPGDLEEVPISVMKYYSTLPLAIISCNLEQGKKKSTT